MARSRSAFKLSPLALSIAALCATAGNPALAQTKGDALQLDATTVTATETPKDAPPPAYTGGQVATGGQIGILGNQENMSLPFSATSYTAKLMEDQQAHDLADVLSNDASIRRASGYANASNIFVIRGYKLNVDDISYGGLYGILPRQLIDTEALERVEVFKGPNAFVNGITPTGSGIGGGVNLLPKRADDTPTRRITTDYTSDGQLGEHLDLGQRFGEDNRFGARLNLMQREGDTAIDHENQRSKLFALGLDYRGDRLRLSTDLGYQKQRINGDRNMISLGSATRIPDAPSADTNYGQKWAYTELEDTFGMGRAEFDLNDDWTLYAAAGAKHTREVGEYSSPSFSSADGKTLSASRSFIPHDEDNKSAMAGLRGRIQTGPVSHQLNLGVAGIWAEQRSAYVFSGTSFSNDLDHPQQVAAPPLSGGFAGGDLSDPGIIGKTRNRSAALSDTLGFVDDKVLLTLGVRRQSLEVDSWSYGGARQPSYDEAITTPVYGLVIKPWENVSFYANRIEGLTQGPTAPTSNGNVVLVNAGEMFPPARSKQIEAGVKYDQGTFGATFGVYRIEQPADGYSQGNAYVRDGEQENRGLELNVFGEPLVGLCLLAGATWMDTELKGTQDGSNDGNRAIGVPRFQYNLGADWDVPGLAGVSLNGRLLRTGGQYADAANNLSIPAWTRVDLGARYRFKVEQKDVTLRANVENVANKAYWESAFGGYLTQGDPRTLKVSATLDF